MTYVLHLHETVREKMALRTPLCRRPMNERYELMTIQAGSINILYLTSSWKQWNFVNDVRA